MTKTFGILESKRNEYKKFFNTSVVPLMGEVFCDFANKHGFAEVAQRIRVNSIQERYCKLAIELLIANINNERPQATLISVPEKDSTLVVASTLLISAWVYSGEASI